MVSTSNPNIAPIANLTEGMPDIIVDAAIFCSLPHWFDTHLASAIIEQFINVNEINFIFTQLVNLPFIYVHQDGTWQYTINSRRYFNNQLVKRQEDYYKLSNFLVNNLQTRWNRLTEDDKSIHINKYRIKGDLDWTLRQIQWQIAYHWAPLDPTETITRLLMVSEWAGNDRKRLADHKLVVEVYKEQSTHLNAYYLEGKYLEGLYEFSRGNHRKAEIILAYVWENGSENQLLTAQAGHLLAVIRRRKGKTEWINDAERILRKSLDICEKTVGVDNNRVLELSSRILNSLGATLIQEKEPSSLEEAKQLLLRALELHENLDDLVGKSHVLNTLGMLMGLYGDEDHLLKAEELIKQALDISESLGNDQSISIQGNSLAYILTKLGGEARFEYAQVLLYRSLRIAEQGRDEFEKALILNRLGDLLLEWGGDSRLSAAEDCFNRSYELWRAKENNRGQYEALLGLALIMQQKGQYTKHDEYIVMANQIEL